MASEDFGKATSGQTSKPLLGLAGSPLVSRSQSSGCRCSCTRTDWAGSLAPPSCCSYAGWKTGKPHATVAQTLRYDPVIREAVVCSAWGPATDWICNIRARPALRVQIARESFAPEQHFLSEDEAFDVAVECRDRHPWRLRLLMLILGWGDLSSDTAAREFVRERPFVSFRPANSARATRHSGSIPPGLVQAGRGDRELDREAG